MKRFFYLCKPHYTIEVKQLDYFVSETAIAPSFAF